MKKILFLTSILLLTLATGTHARNDLQEYDFQDVVEHGYEEGILDRDIRFYLIGQNHGQVIKNHGQYKSNKKTNGVNKSDFESCQWVLLSVLKTFQKRAQSLGANAVINIKSNYKGKEFVSSENFQCGVGMLMSGVALKGDVAEIN